MGNDVKDGAGAVKVGLRRQASFLGNASYELGRVNPAHDYVIDGLMFFKQDVSMPDVKRVIEEKLLLYPRFRSVLVNAEAPGPHSWQEVESVDLDYHIVEYQLPAPGDKETIYQLIGQLHSARLNTDRPLWRIYVLRNFREGGAILSRIHHVIGDGTTLSSVFFSLYEAKGPTLKSPGSGIRKRRPKPLLSSIIKPQELGRRLWVFLYGIVHGLTLASSPFDTPTSLKIPGGCSNLSARKAVALSETVPLSIVKDIKDRFGGTVNDVLVAAVAGAIRRYLLQKDEIKPGMRLRTVFPYDTRIKHPIDLSDPKQFGNQFTLLTMSLPVDTEDVVERLHKCKREVDDLKVSPEMLVTMGLNKLGSMLLPPEAYRKATYDLFDRFTLLFTNVAGPAEEVYFAGQKMENCAFFVPALVGLIMAVVTYNNQLTMGLLADPSTVPHPNMLGKHFVEELNEMHRVVLSRTTLPRAPTDLRGWIVMVVLVLIAVFYVYLSY